MIRLPGLCIVCREPVVWNGKRWRKPGHGSKHICSIQRPVCGVWMPRLRERCVRRPHDNDDHRSEYALDNARSPHKRWTRSHWEPHFVDRMARKNLDNGRVQASITEVQR